MTGDALPPNVPSPARDGESEAWERAVRTAATGPVVVTAQETDAAWQQLAARLATAPERTQPTELTPLAGRQRRGWPRWTTVAAAAALVGVVLWRRAGASTEMHEATAPAGQRVSVQLADGSTMTLAAGSRAQWPQRFGHGAREVQLTGEAYFEVAHDTRHPFRVRVGRGVVEDIGTRFLVEAWSDTAALSVVVTEGLVAVADSVTHATRPLSTLTRVQAGERAALLADGAVRVAAADSGALAWLTGSLVFANTPLRDALPTLARWYGVRVEADSALLSRRLTGRFVQQPLPQLLQALGLALNVRVEQHGTSIRLVP